MVDSGTPPPAEPTATGKRPEPPPGPVMPTMFCRQCNYVLDGLPENRCPECGREFDPAQPATFLPKPELPVPWESNAAVVCVMVSYLVLLFGSMDETRPETLLRVCLFAFALGFAISGIRRKGPFRKVLGWIALIATLPWWYIFAMEVLQEVTLERACHWHAFRAFWGLGR
jgi:hypothetical protein